MTVHHVGSYRDRVQYEMRIAGRLGARWAAWFDDLELAVDDDGTTVLRGALADQAALHGLIAKLRDLGVPLISVVPLPEETPTIEARPSS
jgi:hypothetical protein